MLAAVAAITAATAPAHALRYQERPGWMIGVGMGYGRGAFEGTRGRLADYRNGAVAHIHAGRMLGQHFMVGAAYEGWMVEIGSTISDSVAIKFRRSLQNFAGSLTWFPGDPHGPTGGIFLRGTAGVGWAGTAGTPIFADEAQHNAARIDEWGTGMSFAAGYEIWISHNVAAGMAATFDYFTIDERIVDHGGFSALVMSLGIHF